MPDNDDEIDLQPIDPYIIECKQIRANEFIRKATAVIELEEICAAADNDDYLKLGAYGYKFGIRHLVLGTSLTAGALTLIKQFGPAGAAMGIPLALLVCSWLFVRDRERGHAAELSRRLREFEQNREYPRIAPPRDLLL